MGNVAKNFINQLEAHGFKARVVSVEHIKELQSDIENIRIAHKDVNDYIGKYLNKFNYSLPENISEAKSIIVIAAPQPISRTHFTLGTKKHTVIMPPTYLFNTSSEPGETQKKIAELTGVLEKILSPENYKAIKVNLPGKLAAARSGLGAYGKNNICYIDNQSSFYWIGVYISNMPCESDSWKAPAVMAACEGCDLCLKNCPTGAIANDRFIIHANKCITLLNENKEDFPEWLNPKWHNSLIGCMKCQLICPINKNHINGNIVDSAEFDDLETRMLLAKTPLAEQPEATYRKLESIGYVEDYDLLARNLSVMINNEVEK